MSSGVSIVVPSSNAISVDGLLTLFDANGVQVASRQVTVKARNQLLQLGPELFPELTMIKNGTITAEFNGEVAVTSIKFHREKPLFSLNLLSGAIAQ